MLIKTGTAVLALTCAVATTQARADAVVTFDDGPEGWTGPGSTFIESEGGNPGANLHTIFSDFGITIRNSTHDAFVTDYTRWPMVRLEIDVKVNSVRSFGMEVPRPWLLDLRDLDDPPGSYPWVSVWYELTMIERNPEWVTYGVTIFDTTAEAVPPGWGGYGAESKFGEPMLPPDRTFADVLAGIDQVAFTTLKPGFFFIQTDFDIQLDNIRIDTCPVDFDDSGAVGTEDLLAVLAAWGPCEGCPEDLDGDGNVGTDELILVIGKWGSCVEG
jgi:hypothetical protein